MWVARSSASGTTPNDFSSALTYTVVAGGRHDEGFLGTGNRGFQHRQGYHLLHRHQPGLRYGHHQWQHNCAPYPISQQSPRTLPRSIPRPGHSVWTLGSQQSGTTVVYSSPQNYVVKAGDGSENTYAVVVTVDDVVPSLTTGSVSSIGTTSAQVGGSIVHSGGASLAISDSGICWSTSSSPTIADSHLSAGAAAAGYELLLALVYDRPDSGQKVLRERLCDEQQGARATARRAHSGPSSELPRPRRFRRSAVPRVRARSTSPGRRWRELPPTTSTTVARASLPRRRTAPPPLRPPVRSAA